MAKAMKSTATYRHTGGIPGPAGSGAFIVETTTHNGVTTFPSADVRIGAPSQNKLEHVCVMNRVRMVKQKRYRDSLCAQRVDPNTLGAAFWVKQPHITSSTAGTCSKAEVARIALSYFSGQYFPPMPREVILALKTDKKGNIYH
jgi:hypothetical protein